MQPIRPFVLRSVLSSLLAVTTAFAAPAAQPAAKYTLRVKLADPRGQIHLVPVAEVARVGDKVKVTALAAPEVDKLADDLAQRWKAWKPPASITITESIASSTGMRPDYHDHSATFTKDDKLYQAAVVRQFAQKYGYEVLGMRSVDFIIYDATAESPPNANDRASTRSNFRKNTEGLNYSNGSDSMFVFTPVHPKPEGGSTGPNRASRIDPKLAVEPSYDDGTLEVGWLELKEDGTIVLTTEHAGARIARELGSFTPREASVAVRDHGEYKYLKVAPDSPWNLEAQLVAGYEGGLHFDITPAIDPAVFR